MVSIPFSTIKSSCESLPQMSFKYVSIPFSTIKRDTAAYVASYTNRFQFHLVRLKVAAMTGAVAAGLTVSIPFSTVKSKNDNVNLNYIIKFQFHLVRLKAHLPITI